MKKKKDDLKLAITIYLLLALFIIQIIFLVAGYGRLDDSRKNELSKDQLHAYNEYALKMAYSALEYDHDLLEKSYNDAQSDMHMMREALKYVTVDDMRDNPEGVYQWVQVAIKVMEGE